MKPLQCHTTSDSSFPAEFCFSALFECLLEKAFGRIELSFCFCHRVIPSPALLILFVKFWSRSLPECARHRFFVFFFSNSLNSSSSTVFFHFQCVFSKCLIRSIFSECLREIFAKFCFVPRKDFNSSIVADNVDSKFASIFPLFGFLSFPLNSWPNQVASYRKNELPSLCSVAGCWEFLWFSVEVFTAFFCRPLC